jgi:hypothetical protein
MKKVNSLPVIISVLTIVSVCTMILVLQPSILPILNLTGDRTANIGTTLGGIVGPIVSMYSAYLLYEALTAQQQNNKDQRLKSDSDILFILLNQLDKEYDAFVLKQTKGDEIINLTGYEGLSTMCYNFKSNASAEVYEALKVSVDGNKLMYLIRSFVLIKDMISESNFDIKMKDIFDKKLLYYYRAKFKYPILFLTRGFNDVHDPFIEEIRLFQSTNDFID